ncbi:S-layer protein [uncultured archaeon]|nr:S-layer protein [uncultured archaeon]
MPISTNENINEVNIIAPASDGEIINGPFTFIANVIDTAENLNAVYFKFTNSSGWSFSSTSQVSSPGPTSSTGYAFTYVLPMALANGNYAISVDITSNENLNENMATRTFTVYNLPAAPQILAYSPTSPVQTTDSTPQEFSVTFDQAVNTTWWMNGIQVSGNTSVAQDFYQNNAPTPGTWNITVTGSNENGTASWTWDWTVVPSTYTTGNRIWDGSRPDLFGLTYTWNPQSFSGFYYDVNSNVGNESITMTMNSYTDRTINEGNIVYDTTPQEVEFGYSGFGSYQVIGFMTDKYFAGYTSSSIPAVNNPTTNVVPVSTLGQGQLHKVLIDDDTKRTISVGSTLALQEGYVLKAMDISVTDRIMLISLLKDGNEVDTATLQAGQTYVYAPNRVGNVQNLPIIIVRFDSVFSGTEVQAAFLKGVLQISENPISVKTGDQYNDMKVTTAGQNLIEMTNPSAVSLTQGNTENLMGNLQILVADNAALRFALSTAVTGNEVRSTVYRETDANGNPITPVTQWTPYNFGLNTGKTSIGFYYDLDDGIGNENLGLAAPLAGRTISAQNLVYTTTPEDVSFGYSGFGSYQVIGFMADKYFAGYTSSSIPSVNNPTTNVVPVSALGSGQLHKVLIDDDTKRTISVGSTLTLQEGYVLKAKDISVIDRIMLISLLKDGNEVDTATLQAGQTYVYAPNRVVNVQNLPIIIVRFDSVFSGTEVQAAFLKGVFQISENPTTVNTGDLYNDMEVTTVNQNEIMMSNNNDISLDNGKIEQLMGNIKLKVADTSATDGLLRFYFAVDVTPGMMANQLLINVPDKATAGDQITINVTAGGAAVAGASVSIGSSGVGTTDANGLVNYTLPRTMKGVQNITATMLGYQQGTTSIDVLEYIEYRLSIDAPANADQFNTITITTTYNGTAVSGVTIGYDNASIGTTDDNGILNYTLQTSGTHTISASKTGYITAVRNISVRAPYSEYKALDINITPSTVSTNEPALIRSNITNAGTKADTLPVELISNGTVVDNRTVSLAPGEIKEVDFTRKEALTGNYTIEILGQKGLLVVKEQPLNLLLIGGIATVFGAIIIYLFTMKSKIGLEAIRNFFAKKPPVK